MQKGFTLVEMLVVIGIIAVLTAASVVSFSKMMGSADRAKSQELVHQTATALSALYQQNNGVWPKRLLTANSGDGKLDESAAVPLASYMSLKTNSSGELAGLDKFGILDPAGTALVKGKGTSATKSDVEQYILNFAIDVDDDGIVEVEKLGVRVRGTAAVWCYDKKKKVISSWNSKQEVKD